MNAVLLCFTKRMATCVLWFFFFNRIVMQIEGTKYVVVMMIGRVVKMPPGGDLNDDITATTEC
jgi:hypothetical protein